MLRQILLTRHEVQHRGINAISKFAVGAIGKHVAQMDSAALGFDFDAVHAIAMVGMFGGRARHGFGKAQPTGA